MKTRFNLAVIIAAIVACCSLAGCKKVVFEGLETVDAIATVETGANDKPVEDIIIESITFENYTAQ